MQYLIVSDIHANLEALEAVLADARGQYDQILCLGDLVGYGADPNAVIDWARENVTAIVRGNHDKICCGRDLLENYNPAALAAAVWTRMALRPENLAYLEQLARGPLRYDGCDLVHGSPGDEDEYLVGVGDAALIRPLLEAQLTFFGHTHVQGGFLVARGGTKSIAPVRTIELEPDHFYLLNPGAVGQPRDGDPRAAYLLYAPEERVLEYRRVDYRVDAAASKIRAAGLPDSLAARLYAGT